MINSLIVETTNVLPHVIAFIKESNHIEGIKRKPLKAEIEEYQRFMALDEINIIDLKQFVSVYQPNARLRDKVGLDVMVGGYYPPRGGKEILSRLEIFISHINQSQLPAYETHQEYERLHPFTDGNGRSGRMCWMWRMREAPLGFLHTWYYQSLKYGR